MDKIPLSYYQSDDVVAIAKDLIGKKLCTNIEGIYTSGIITETEAYRGWGDKACHAHNNRRTNRTEIMYRSGGVAYVYLCYGLHHLFNIITNKEGNADAVLIRAIEPAEGIEDMLIRRNRKKLDKHLTTGPGKVSQALGISREHYGLDLNSENIWLEEGKKVIETEIITTTRIGVEYAKEDALLPWRFYMKDSKWISKY